MGALRTPVARGSVLLVVLGAAAGHAQQSPVRVEYTAPPGCPTEQVFLEQLRARTERARFAGQGELAQTLKISVERAPERSVARLEFVDTDSQRVKREVSGEDCAEVVSGIALVTALAIDARARKQATHAAPARAPAARPAPPPDPPAQELSVVRRPGAPGRTGLRWDAGLGLLTASGVAPKLLYGLAGFVALSPQAASWSARLTLAYLEGPKVKVDRGEARFRLGVARLEGCPAIWTLVDELVFMPCAALDAGLVSASGEGAGLTDPKTVYVFLPAASALARLQVDLQDFLIFELQGEVGAPLTLTQRRFVFEEPHATVHDVSWVRWGAGAAVGLRFD